MIRLGTGQLGVNPGSVGIQAYEGHDPGPHVVEGGSPHARYAILESTSRGWKADLVGSASRLGRGRQARGSQRARGLGARARGRVRPLVPLERLVAVDRGAVHGASIGQVIGNGVMLGVAVVPERDIADGPAPA